MSEASVHLPDDLMKALRKRSTESNVSIELIVAEAVRQRLSEDEIDIAAFKARRGEDSLSVAELRAHLKGLGKL